MNKNRIITFRRRIPKAILFLIFTFFLLVENIDAQIPWRRPDETQIQFLNRLKRPGRGRETLLNAAKAQIKKGEYVVLGRISETFSFYSQESYEKSVRGRRIYTAAKIRLIHDYTNNLSTRNGFFWLIKEGGFVDGEYQQGHIVKSNSCYPTEEFEFAEDGEMLLFIMKKSLVNIFSDDRKDATYTFSSSAITYSTPWMEDNEYLKRLGFLTDSEFDNFIYSSLNQSHKKKDVGLRDYLIEPTWMKITGIQYPTGSGGKIHAGTREILTIKGNDFGNIKGEVRFRSADKPFISNIPGGAHQYLTGLDQVYIINWSNKEIKVQVPSYISNGANGRTAGSGRFWVYKPKPSGGWKKVISPSSVKVNIEYSILNSTVDGKVIDGIPNYTRYIHAQRYCMNGMVFTLHKSIDDLPEPNRTDMISNIEKALLDWTNEISTSTKEFTLELERDINGNLIFLDIPPSHFSLKDKRNLIALFNISSPMVTSFDGKNLVTSLGNKRAVIGEGTNIIIRPDTKWWYKTTGDLPANKRDFYAHFLHELGHVIGVGHDVDLSAGLKNLMSWSHGLYNVVIPAADRISIANHSTRCKIGAHANIDFSRSISFNEPDFKFYKQLNNTESQIYTTPTIGSNYQPFTFPSSSNSFNPPFNFWIDNYSTVLSPSGSRICTSNFDFLWK